MLKQLRSSLKSHHLPYLSLGIGLLLIHIIAPIPVGDDIVFQTRPKGMLDLGYFIARYHGWSSRLIIEFFTVALLKLPNIIWRLLNPIIITFFAIIISNIFVEFKRGKSNWMLVFLIFLYPLREILAGGWVTVSLNYFWPMTFASYSLYLIKKIITGREIAPLSGIISLLLLLYALNQEIISGIFFIIYLLANLYLIIKRKYHWFSIACLFLSIVSLIFIITTPGNVARGHIETRWFVDFHYLTLVEKLEIGLSSTFSQYFFHFSILFLIFCLLLYLNISANYESVIFRGLGLIPLVNLVIFGNIFNSLIGGIYPHLISFDRFLPKYGLITLGNFTDIKSHIVFFILYFSMFLLFINLYLVYGKSWKSFMAIGILGLGLISRLVISFSPTIWASGLRTHFLLLFSIIIICIMLFQELFKKKSSSFIDNLLIFCGFCASYSFLNTIMAIT